MAYILSTMERHVTAVRVSSTAFNYCSLIAMSTPSKDPYLIQRETNGEEEVEDPEPFHI
jgi:hypothetical protein